MNNEPHLSRAIIVKVFSATECTVSCVVSKNLHKFNPRNQPVLEKRSTLLIGRKTTAEMMWTILRFKRRK